MAIGRAVVYYAQGALHLVQELDVGTVRFKGMCEEGNMWHLLSDRTYCTELKRCGCLLSMARYVHSTDWHRIPNYLPNYLF